MLDTSTTEWHHHDDLWKKVYCSCPWWVWHSLRALWHWNYAWKEVRQSACGRGWTPAELRQVYESESSKVTGFKDCTAWITKVETLRTSYTSWIHSELSRSYPPLRFLQEQKRFLATKYETMERLSLLELAVWKDTLQNDPFALWNHGRSQRVLDVGETIRPRCIQERASCHKWHYSHCPRRPPIPRVNDKADWIHNSSSIVVKSMVFYTNLLAPVTYTIRRRSCHFLETAERYYLHSPFNHHYNLHFSFTQSMARLVEHPFRYSTRNDRYHNRSCVATIVLPSTMDNTRHNRHLHIRQDTIHVVEWHTFVVHTCGREKGQKWKSQNRHTTINLAPPRQEWSTWEVFE